jgi:hypothetical protein
MTVNIQPGHIARHTPQGAGSQGRDAHGVSTISFFR